MTILDPDISKGIRVLQACGLLVVLAIMGAVIAFLVSGWNASSADARASQRDYRNQVEKTETLQSEYNKLYSEYMSATGKEPKAPSPQSVQGATGPQGDMGLPGQMGPQGRTGEKGDQGATGPAGIPGSTGATGAKGDSGSPGEAGPVGEIGPQGAPGATGAMGPAGPQGIPGPQGNPGPGRGVSSFACDGSGASSSWTITYTDGTSQQLAGPCRAEIAP